jgi:hypothetical protein
MYFSCWITKGTDINSEHVIPTGFTRQQRFRESSSMLHCTERSESRCALRLRYSAVYRDRPRTLNELKTAITA